MKKALAWLLVIAMTAALAVGGTLAYLTDTDDDVNVMTVGQVKIDQLEYERVNVDSEDEDATVQEFHDNKPLYPAVTEDGFDYTPGDTYVDWDQIGKDGYTSEIWDPTKINNEQDKMVFVKNKGDWDAYVRTVFGFEANGYTLAQFKDLFHLNLNETDWTWEWTESVDINGTNYIIATATYNKVLAPGAITEISLSQIALDSKATNADIESFGDTYQILVQSQAVQAAGFEDADTALNEAFGEIDVEADPPEIPFEDDNPTKGVDVKTAIHYLNGSKSSTKITSKVSKIVFGLNEDYSDIVNNYDPVVVDVEQDVPANAYYVPNGSNYEVYVLSNDVIYAPRNSESLFDYMSALKTLNTDNFDFSRAETLQYGFYGCSSLTEVDSTDWNLSNVTTMNQCFYNCSKLASMDVSNWDVGNVTSFYYTFYGCKSLTSLDVSEWDTSSATTMSRMFRGASGLTELDVSKWDVSNVTDLCQTFMSVSKVPHFAVENWNVSNAVDMRNMFYNCDGITTMDLSKWNISNVKNFEGMFAEVSNMTNLDMTGWQPTSAETMYSMFYYCTSLQSIDLSGWQMPNLLTTSHMFRSCQNAATIDVSGWYTPSLTSMDAMFHTCYKITELDVSSFDTSNCQEFSQLFEYATALQTIKGLENWDTSKAGTFEQTFSGCSALKELDLSSWSTESVVDQHPMQNGAIGYAFSQMFANCSNLQKLSLGAEFSFNANGNVTTANTVSLPDPGKIDGQTTVWYNAANDTYYTAAEIPEKTAATYIAVVQP